MEKTIPFIINDTVVETPLPAGTVTLDFIRRHRHLEGTKEGCREGECGACTVLLGQLTDRTPPGIAYKAVASCLLPLGDLHGKHLVTLEGLNRPGLNPIQQALVEEGAVQCGFCTPGIILSLTGLFLSGKVEYESAVDALDGNICRCTGYVSIERAVKRLCETFGSAPLPGEAALRVRQLAEWSILPEYFLDIPARLKRLAPRPEFSPPEDAVLVAGGTDIYVQQGDELAGKNLAFMSRRRELDAIKTDEKENHICLGANVTFQEIKDSPLLERHLPGIEGYLQLVSSTIMRNRATVAGNIVNASPIGDLSIMLLALEAEVTLSDGRRERNVPLKDFFRGYKKLALEPGEMVTWVRFPVPEPGSFFHFEKVSRRKYLDIAGCNSAVGLRVENHTIADIHLSAGGVAPVPLYLERTSRFLRGKEIEVSNIRQAVETARQEISPISDVRGSAEYKRLLLGRLLFAHFITLFPDKIQPEVLP